LAHSVQAAILALEPVAFENSLTSSHVEGLARRVILMRSDTATTHLPRESFPESLSFVSKPAREKLLRDLEPLGRSAQVPLPRLSIIPAVTLL